MKNQKDIGVFAAFLLGLGIFTYIVFHLSVGWFTIVMSVFVAIIFALILMSPDEKEDIKK
jgi:high-affinity Fe2+/Pb2+ permease